jgi:hypothetical protein
VPISKQSATLAKSGGRASSSRGSNDSSSAFVRLRLQQTHSKRARSSGPGHQPLAVNLRLSPMNTAGSGSGPLAILRMPRRVFKCVCSLSWRWRLGLGHRRKSRFDSSVHQSELVRPPAHPSTSPRWSETSRSDLCSHDIRQGKPANRSSALANQLARKREDRCDDEGPYVEESSGSGGPCGEDLIERVTPEDRVHSFAYPATDKLNARIRRTLTDSEHTPGPPADRFQIRCSTIR